MCCARRSAGKTISTDLKSDSKSTSFFNSTNHYEAVELEDIHQFSDEETKSDLILEPKLHDDLLLRRPATFTVETGTQTFEQSLNKTFARDEILSRREKAKSGK